MAQSCPDLSMTFFARHRAASLRLDARGLPSTEKPMVTYVDHVSLRENVERDASCRMAVLEDGHERRRTRGARSLLQQQSGIVKLCVGHQQHAWVDDVEEVVQPAGVAAEVVPAAAGHVRRAHARRHCVCVGSGRPPLLVAIILYRTMALSRV